MRKIYNSTILVLMGIILVMRFSLAGLNDLLFSLNIIFLGVAVIISLKLAQENEDLRKKKKELSNLNEALNLELQNLEILLCESIKKVNQLESCSDNPKILKMEQKPKLDIPDFLQK